MIDIDIRLAAPLTLPNRIPLGKTWQAAAGRKAMARKALAWEVLAGVGRKPAQPLQHATVQVWRHGIRAPDADNLHASLKGLLDVLQPNSKRHPYGLGIIAGDDPAHVHVRVYHVDAAKRCDQHTRVVIRELSEAAFAALTMEQVAA